MKSGWGNKRSGKRFFAQLEVGAAKYGFLDKYGPLRGEKGPLD